MKPSHNTNTSSGKNRFHWPADSGNRRVLQFSWLGAAFPVEVRFIDQGSDRPPAAGVDIVMGACTHSSVAGLGVHTQLSVAHSVKTS